MRLPTPGVIPKERADSGRAHGEFTMHRLTILGMLLISACYVQGPSKRANGGAASAELKASSEEPGSCERVPCPASHECVEADGGARCALRHPAADAADGGACQVDSDCRLFSDYCDGCYCRALGPGERKPTCKADLVACFVDPCRNLESHCDSGRCVARPPGEVQ
jgi:hypothetical protein